MRKAAAVLSLLLLASVSASAGETSPAKPSGPSGLSPLPTPHQPSPAVTLFASAGPRESPGFTLAGSASAPPSTEPPALDLQEPEAPPVAESVADIPVPRLAREAAAPRLALSVFLGRGGKDIFSLLHSQYTWRVLSRSMTVGVGLYRAIPVSRGVELLPYVGVIRASATLRPSDLYGNRESYEYELTAFCVGLPLVIRFN